MTTPKEVREIEYPGEPIGPEGTAGMHAHFEDNNPLPHNEIRAARLAGLQALQNAGVLVVRPRDMQETQSAAAVNIAQNAIPKEKMH